MEVVGLTSIKSKSGDIFTKIFVIESFTPYEIKNSVGNKVDKIFVRGAYDLSIGSKIKVVYGKNYKGLAIVEDIEIIK